MNGKISYSITECPTADVLAPEWLNLQEQGDCGFFLSWGWISIWLSRVSSPPKLFRAELDGITVALAVIGRESGGKKRFLLNESGTPSLDSLYMEYNGILHSREVSKLEKECLLWLSSQFNGLDAQRMHPHLFSENADSTRLRLIESREAPWLDFSAARQEDKSVLEMLSRNSRQQIRRAMRLHDNGDGLNLHRAADCQEAHDMLDRLAELHQASWMARGKPGAFADPVFTDMHRDLITNRFDAGEIDLIEVSGTAGTIGLLYNFIYRGEALSYQSGFPPVIDKHDKPGLICHVVAAQDYLNRGLSAYRFLCGDSQYKRSLSNRTDTLASYTNRRPTLKERLKSLISPDAAPDGDQ